jgi:hypothetical protein
MKIFSGFLKRKSKMVAFGIVVVVLLASVVGVVSGYESGGGCIPYLYAEPDSITADGKSTTTIYFKVTCPGKCGLSLVPNIGVLKVDTLFVEDKPMEATYTAPTTQELGDYKEVTLTITHRDSGESKSVTISLVPDCEIYCKEKFDKEQPASLMFIEGKGEHPFCYCICMDEKTGEEVICWEEDWDCENYCSEMYKNKQWDSISEWPYCQCICKQGYEEREKEGCVPCKDICKKKGGEHYIEDKEKSEQNSCACKCEDGYDDSYSEKCEKVECPPNSTNVAELGGSCPKDRILNRHCCCDAGYVKWYEVCIKEEDVPGKVVCGKWGCQEGEDCINCPEDCGCIAPEICDPFSKYANPETGCSPKVAYIFISSEIDTYEYYWILYKINHIRKYYRSLGYKTITVRVNNLDDVVDKLSNPSTKAIAYFGHAIEPSIEYSDATGIGNLMYQTLYSMYQYPASGINDEEARRRASERSARPNLDYAYIHTCSSLDDPSLADYLLHSGGTYWGEKDKLYAVEWLDEYVKP